METQKIAIESTDYIETSFITTGVYEVYWVSGGMTLATIGVSRGGERWIAPVNWVEPKLFNESVVNSIEKLVKVKL